MRTLAPPIGSSCGRLDIEKGEFRVFLPKVPLSPYLFTEFIFSESKCEKSGKYVSEKWGKLSDLRETKIQNKKIICNSSSRFVRAKYISQKSLNFRVLVHAKIVVSSDHVVYFPKKHKKKRRLVKNIPYNVQL